MGRLLRILGLAIASAYFASMLALNSATATIPTPPSPSLATDLTGQTALLNLSMNRSRVGILPAGNKHETGKMPVLPRCQFYQDAHSTSLFKSFPPEISMKLARCQFYQDASSTKMPIPPHS